MESHLIFLLLYSISALANPCQHHPKSNFPHEDCEKYIYCKQGVPTVGACPDGQVFDIHENICLPGSKSDCTPVTLNWRFVSNETIDADESPLPPLPPCDTETWMRPDPMNCSRFYMCIAGKMEHLICIGDFYFDAKAEVCLPKEEAHCSESPTTATTQGPLPPCAHNDDWSLPYPSDCTKYYKCYSGQVMIVNCPYGYDFSPTQHVCLPKQQADCKILSRHSSNQESLLIHPLSNTNTRPSQVNINVPADDDLKPGESSFDAHFIQPCTVFDVWSKPDPTDCSHYYRCLSGDIERVKCLFNFYFSAKRQVCVPQSVSNCFIPVSSTEANPTTTLDPWPTCDLYDDWFRPDPYDCTMYYLCYYGKMMHVTCQTNYEFSPTELKCLPKELAGCGVFTTTSKAITTLDPWPQCGYYDDWSRPDLYDCTMYRLCYHGEMIQVTCQIDYEFSPIQLICLPKEVAGCSISTTTSRSVTTTPTPTPPCGDYDGWILPDPTSCNRFFQCYYGQVMRITCLFDYEFSPTYLVCVPKEEAGCNIITTTSTTPTPTTQSTTSIKTTPSTTSIKTTPSTTPETPWPICREGILWLQGDPGDSTCKHFILCVFGEITREICPPRYLFDSKLLECVPEKEMVCKPDSTCSETEKWVKPDPYDCRFFIVCVYGEINHKICPPQYEFSPLKFKCLPKEVAGCLITTTTTSTTSKPTTTSTKTTPSTTSTKTTPSTTSTKTTPSTTSTKTTPTTTSTETTPTTTTSTKTTPSTTTSTTVTTPSTTSTKTTPTTTSTETTPTTTTSTKTTPLTTTSTTVTTPSTTSTKTTPTTTSTKTTPSTTSTKTTTTTTSTKTTPSITTITTTPSTTSTQTTPTTTTVKPSSTTTKPLLYCKIDDIWLQPDLRDCEHFILCIYGQITREKCPPLYDFSPVALQCQPKPVAGCTITTTTSTTTELTTTSTKRTPTTTPSTNSTKTTSTPTTTKTTPTPTTTKMTPTPITTTVTTPSTTSTKTTPAPTTTKTKPTPTTTKTTPTPTTTKTTLTPTTTVVTTPSTTSTKTTATPTTTKTTPTPTTTKTTTTPTTTTVTTPLTTSKKTTPTPTTTKTTPKSTTTTVTTPSTTSTKTTPTPTTTTVTTPSTTSTKTTSTPTTTKTLPTPTTSKSTTTPPNTTVTTPATTSTTTTPTPTTTKTTPTPTTTTVTTPSTTSTKTTPTPTTTTVTTPSTTTKKTTPTKTTPKTTTTTVTTPSTTSTKTTPPITTKTTPTPTTTKTTPTPITTVTTPTTTVTTPTTTKTTPPTTVTTPTTTKTTPTTTKTTLTTTVTTPTPTTTSTTDNPQPSCGDSEYWPRPDPNDCRFFYICVYGDIMSEQCPDGKEFSPIDFECQPIEKAQCSITTTTEPTTTSTTLKPYYYCDLYDSWSKPDPNDCEHFYLCIYGHRMNKACPKGSEFSPTQFECKPKAEAGCTVIPHDDGRRNFDTHRNYLASGNIHRDTRDTKCLPISERLLYFAEDPKDCSSYYICCFGRSTYLKCPESFSFSAELQICLPSHHVQCKNKH